MGADLPSNQQDVRIFRIIYLQFLYHFRISKYDSVYCYWQTFVYTDGELRNSLSQLLFSSIIFYFSNGKYVKIFLLLFRSLFFLSIRGDFLRASNPISLPLKSK